MTLGDESDSLNHRVRENRPAIPSNFEFVFDAAGRRVSTWNFEPTAGAQVTIYADSNNPVAYRNGSGTYFEHYNWVGTKRLMTTYNGAVDTTVTSLPWGDAESSTAGDWTGFAGMDDDVESTTEHAQFRQYSPAQGRWVSPDPYYGSYDIFNPQSFNRYAYAYNNPVSFIDPSGLYAGQPYQCGTYDDGTPMYCMQVDTFGTGTNDGGDGIGPPPPFLRVMGGGGGALGSVKATAQCAAAHASSLASLLGISNNNLLGQTLLGNDISTLSNIVTGPGQGMAGLQAAVSNPTPANLLYQAGSAIGSSQTSQLALVQTASQDAFGNPQFYARALSVAETGAGKALSEAFGAFSAGKLAYDVGAYAVAYAQCSAGTIH